MLRASPESPRMFKSDFVDFFSRTPWWIVLVIWVPIVLGLIGYGVVEGGVAWLWLGLQIICGAFFWTAAEYWLHRTLFHWEPDFELGKRFHFIIHGVHHTWVDDKYRLVMPPAAGFMIASFFWFGLKGLALVAAPWFSPSWLHPFFGGFLAGYINYDVTHYWTHHFKVRSMRLKRIRAHHMSHHFNDPDRKYGISTTFWDRICRTM
jgi:sterol desaturase/sphingolipid hydroxylase (fatty acid hydroxylase superfamily)